MSWPLASFLLVFGMLTVGWLVYERSRPSARMAAVVGTLAAIAALGRDAFVALPDVKPITAITLVVGYALGPLPGFTVGAMGMLASNILLGQGPYTPWQMAAWGLVGLVGAVLGRLSGRRLGRLGLASACAVMALVAKEIMNFYEWTLAATHTPATFLLLAGRGLPFDVTDTVASFLFGLAFGPELARLLGRMRARMTVTWEAAPTAPLVLLAIVGCVAGATAWSVGAARAGAVPTARVASGGSSGVISRAVAFLEGAQNPDGGFGGASGRRSSELYSSWAAIGLAAARRSPLGFSRAGHTVLDSIYEEASTLEGAGDLERTILALHACGVSTHDLDGVDPVARLLRYRTANGSFSNLVNLTSFAILALRAAGEPASNPTVRGAAIWLARQQNPDGGFSYAERGATSDIDDTAAALQAVVAASVPDGPVVEQATSFLEHAQDPDGGYPQEPDGESNAQSTAWAIQGLVAAGRDPRLLMRHGRSALDYLEGLVASDGSVRYSSTSSQTPVWVTAEALAALALAPFPIAPVPSAPAARVTTARSSARTSNSLSGRHHAGRANVAVSGLARDRSAVREGLGMIARAIDTFVDALFAPMEW
jgi:energy-coupling factor transport system substrate-specific component